jgi:hypothetical protein
MVQKLKTDRAASGETAKSGAPRPPAKPRETVGSAYDSFWHCLSGRRPGERWARDRDVAPLGSLRAAFGLAEETQPINYGRMGQTGRDVPAAKPSAGPSRETDESGRVRPRPRRD